MTTPDLPQDKTTLDLDGPLPPVRPSIGLLRQPACLIALGFGSGLSPIAPGTVGSAWAWLSFAVIQALTPSDQALPWVWLWPAAALVGWWAITVCAQQLRSADPGAIVWDEVLAFWLVLIVLSPSSLGEQAMAFALFRYFDAAKPGPVAWADRRFKVAPGATIGAWQGFGIILDDLVAAACTLLVMAIGQALF